MSSNDERAEASNATKAALVTGAASGIGAEVCRRLASEGWTPIVADIDLPAAEALAADVRGHALCLDVADDASWYSAVDTVRDTVGGVDAAVLNAGLAGGGSPIDLDRERYRQLFSVNVDGVALGLSHLLPCIEERAGSITVTASLAGLTGIAFDPIYAMTKHAVIGLVRSCHDELVARGVRFQAVCPGLVDTPLLGRAKGQAREAGYPLITPSVVAQVLCECVEGSRTDLVTVVQPGRDPVPYVFAGVPGPVNAVGSGLPDDLSLGAI